MKKIALLSLMLVMFMVGSAFATVSRTQGLGNVGYYIHDDSNIYEFPGLISKYHNQVVAELGTSSVDNRYGNVNYYFEKIGIDIGYHFNLPVSNYPGNTLLDNVSLTTKSMLTVGMGNLGFGIALGGESWSDPSETDGLESESTQIVELIGGFSRSDGQLPIDLGARISLLSGEAAFKGSGQPGDADGSGFELSMQGRLWMDVSDITLVPVFKFGIGATSITQDDATGMAYIDSSIASLNIGIGIGLNHQINKKNLLILAFEPVNLHTTSNETKISGNESKVDSSRFTLPAMYAAIESKPTSWLTVRVGAAQRTLYTSGSVEVNGTSTDFPEYKNSEFGFSFGLGFEFNNFQIDGVFNDQFMYDGPQFISGVSNTLFNRLSIRYTW